MRSTRKAPPARPSLTAAVLLCSLCALAGGCGRESRQAITITSPSAGDRWAVGAEEMIRWDSEGIDRFRLELSRDGGATWEVIAASLTGSASSATVGYTWTVDGGGLEFPQLDCLIRVSAPDHPGVSAISGEFTIWSGTVWYANAGAATWGDGTSWATPYQQLHSALIAASAGDEIWVAGGTYSPCIIKEGVAVYGGFAGTETDRSERDIEVNETALDGAGAGRVATLSSRARLDGFTIRNGAAQRGGGVVNDTYAGRIVVAHCTFLNNSSLPTGDSKGGAVYNDPRSEVIIESCTFVDNSSGMQGGAVYSAEGSDVLIRDCRFRGNTAGTEGGAVASFRSSCRIVGCAFVGNSAATLGGAVRGNGAVYDIVNCTFTGNSAGEGGAAYVHDAIRAGVPDSTLTNCVLWGNTATTGSPEIGHDLYVGVTLRHSCVGDYRYAGGEECFLADPLFVDAASGDVRLLPGSPCIDAADGDVAPEFDIDGLARHDDPAVADFGTGAITFTDIGTHEFQGTSPEMAVVCFPAAGTSWRVGRAEEIRWLVAGAEHVAIELSRDGGLTWETIASAALNDRRETWTVTDGGTALPHTSCLIGISDAADGEPSAVSEPFTIFSGVWYVDAAAAPGGDGLSWASAFTHPQDAADVAPEGHEMWVAAGTYPRRTAGDAVVLALQEDVEVYGGLAGTEASLAERDLWGPATVLDGEGALGSVVFGASRATLDGFTVTGGNAGDGGGLCALGCSRLSVANCTFFANSASIYGGGVWFSGEDCSIVGCTFRANTAWYGGGMSDNDAVGSYIANCVFEGNRAYSRGGLDNRYSADIVSCTFVGNRAEDRSGGCTTSSGLVGCIFWGNSAGWSGPDITYGSPDPERAIRYSCISQPEFTGDAADHNISADPLFATDGYWDDKGTPDLADDEWIPGDYHLQPGSPCIDAGDPGTELTEDIEGNHRPAGSGYDMGAYEQ